MAKKKSSKKPVKKASKAAAKNTHTSRSASQKKSIDSSQFKLVSIYIILGIIFLGYIFYHSNQNKQPTSVNDIPIQETK